MSSSLVKQTLLGILFLILPGCSDEPLNNPHPPEVDDDIVYYSFFDVSPQHFDPAVSYSALEAVFLDQIYDAPLAYHFLKRPYELIPAAAVGLPGVEYLGKDKKPVDASSEQIAYTRYTIHLRSDLQYQPHPAFAKDDQGESLYVFESADEGKQYKSPADFPKKDSRQAVAKDFVYQIKRLADPKNKSPMLNFMGRYIVGMDDFTQRLRDIEREGWLNMDDYEMEGLEVIDDQTYSILVYGQYPQFVYWLAMHFFTAVPLEVDRFYQNPGFKEKNLTLDWYPVGTGAFMVTENDPNNVIVLEQNPNFYEAYYPSEGNEGDRERGYLDDAGKRVPFIDKAVYRLEKEPLPYWSKFVQGYYDRSGEGHANTHHFFDQAFILGEDGVELTEVFQEQGFTIAEDLAPTINYYGFNMHDPVVGGYTEEARKLRQALSIAYDQEEYINIFYKGTAIPAQGPIPPGIPGYIEGREGINPYIYDWVDGKPKRKSIEYAKQLLAEAGYPNGRDRDTGEPLKLFLDVQEQAIKKAHMDWMRRNLERLGVQIEFRLADFNRTLEKNRKGNTQIFSSGWRADYPDPENFLLLLYGPEGNIKCQCDGTNDANYENPEFDQKFVEDAAQWPAGSESRDKLVAELVDMVRREAVWMSGYHQVEAYTLITLGYLIPSGTVLKVEIYGI